MNGVFFDIEGESIPEDWDNHDPLDLYCGCAVMHYESTERNFRALATQFWWAGMSEMEEHPAGSDDLCQAYLEGRLPVNKVMTPEEIEQMYDGMVSLSKNYGWLFEDTWLPIFSHNGANYDFAVIAAHLPHRKDDIIETTVKSFDLCFQAMRDYGFPIGLEKIALVMLDRGKVEGISGAKVTSIWPMDADTVFRYVEGDCWLTHDALVQIKKEKLIRWLNSRDEVSTKKIKTFWSVERGIKHTYQGDKKKAGLPIREPYRQWMSDYNGQYDLNQVVGWLGWEDFT